MSVLKANSSDILKHSKLSKKEEVNSYLRKKKKKNCSWESDLRVPYNLKKKSLCLDCLFIVTSVVWYWCFERPKQLNKHITSIMSNRHICSSMSNWNIFQGVIDPSSMRNCILPNSMSNRHMLNTMSNWNMAQWVTKTLLNEQQGNYCEHFPFESQVW